MTVLLARVRHMYRFIDCSLGNTEGNMEMKKKENIEYDGIIHFKEQKNEWKNFNYFLD
jgi:hypothetical protein